MVENLTYENFDISTSEGVVLTDFWAEWCAPCRMQSPIIYQLDDEIGNQVKFTKVDVDNNQQVATSLGIRSITTLVVKKNGEIVEKLVGFHTKDQLKKVLAYYA